jgi:perosamine synthetase
MRGFDKPGETRRAFVGAGAAVTAGLGASGPKVQSRESLAVSGGPKAVTFPADKTKAIVKWPRYGQEDKSVVMSLLEDNNWYPEIPALEKEMKEYLNVPYVKAHMNGASALMSLFFALDLPAGSEILAPSYTAWATTAPMHLFGHVPAFVDPELCTKPLARPIARSA